MLDFIYKFNLNNIKIQFILFKLFNQEKYLFFSPYFFFLNILGIFLIVSSTISRTSNTSGIISPISTFSYNIANYSYNY